MARHPSAQTPTAARRALVRAGLALTTAAGAVGAGAATASAAVLPHVETSSASSLGKIDPEAGLKALTGTVGYVTGPVAGLKPNPLAGTGTDPLDNGIGTQVADFQPVSTTMLTAPLAQAESLGGVPVVGQAAGALG
ncbi:hypothetical protein [Streptomyces minutiscleroticus]|uniref:Secreted protein n=1 Tax=Streptomyces minutiscleroticus TaxID=68238 RepID=A0A918NCP8_9ACTN|nr:hypothetical protein [Streptomyces minutiscleroticus]GGX57988.1 hypothetical protein GCM10010358_10330 [Streptomyces minutiscleroticus]